MRKSQTEVRRNCEIRHPSTVILLHSWPVADDLAAVMQQMRAHDATLLASGLAATRRRATSSHGRKNIVQAGLIASVVSAQLIDYERSVLHSFVFRCSAYVGDLHICQTATSFG